MMTQKILERGIRVEAIPSHFWISGWLGHHLFSPYIRVIHNFIFFCEIHSSFFFSGRVSFLLFGLSNCSVWIMGTPEFPDLGKHCSVSDCRLIDFLPFTCDRCNQVLFLLFNLCYVCPVVFYYFLLVIAIINAFLFFYFP